MTPGGFPIRAYVSVSILLLALFPAVALAQTQEAVVEDWESGDDGWVETGDVAISTLCGDAHGCFARLDPGCCGIMTYSRDVSLALEGVTEVAWRFRNEVGHGDTDSLLQINFDSSYVWYTWTAGWGQDNRGILVGSGDRESEAASWSSVETWYQAALIIDPDAAVAYGELRSDAGDVLSRTGLIPFGDAASSIARFTFHAAQWNADEAHSFDVDDIRVRPYGVTDTDGDGIADPFDNCVSVVNPGQEDVDSDGLGDACDTHTDVDHDGIADGADNCRLIPNAGQEDADGDGIGDACDDDQDGDGVQDWSDNCPDVPNSDQRNSDDDWPGDACDPFDDADGDGVWDGADNCRDVANAGQADLDGDGSGDACDMPLDAEGDGVLDAFDNCMRSPNSDQSDVDGDGVGDACDDVNDLDVDGDGTPNETDNCPSLSNDQSDADGDGIGDACDPDVWGDYDGDGVVDHADNCFETSNADQLDTDGDAEGDACDWDDDGDGLSDDEEEGYGTDPLRADTDGDGAGDGDEVYSSQTDPLDPDTDGDLFGDRTELDGGSDPTDPTSIPVLGGRLLDGTDGSEGPFDEQDPLA